MIWKPQRLIGGSNNELSENGSELYLRLKPKTILVYVQLNDSFDENTTPPIWRFFQ